MSSQANRVSSTASIFMKQTPANSCHPGNFAERSIRDPGAQTLCGERVVPGSWISRCAQFRDDRSSIPQQRGDALDRLADVIDGVGVGEADVAFAVDAEAGAGDGGDAGRFQHLVL